VRGENFFLKLLGFLNLNDMESTRRKYFIFFSFTQYPISIVYWCVFRTCTLSISINGSADHIKDYKIKHMTAMQ